MDVQRPHSGRKTHANGVFPWRKARPAVALLCFCYSLDNRWPARARLIIHMRPLGFRRVWDFDRLSCPSSDALSMFPTENSGEFPCSIKKFDASYWPQ